VLGPDLSVVLNVGLQVVDKEWLSEFKLGVREWHCLEIEGHSSSRFDITELIETTGSVAIDVEESCHGGVVFWEESTVEARVKLLIKIDDMISFWSEKMIELVVGEDCIKDINFISSWLISSISDSSN